MYRILLLLLVFTSINVQAQDDLFMTEKKPARKGFVFGVNGALGIPAADMAKRFGTSYMAGGSVFYKFRSNWLVGSKVDFIFGDKIREDSFLYNALDKYGAFIGQDGRRVGVNIYERGYLIGVQGGRIFNTSKHNSDDGVLVMTTVGFMQHKIFVRDREKTISQIKGDYIKGYDRLTNGWFIEQYAGYTHFSKNGLINFHVGMDIIAGFTAGRRDYLYDVMRPGTDSRLDILYGIKAGWFIPIFKRKSEEFFFE